MLNISLSSPLKAWQQPSPMGFTTWAAARRAARPRRCAGARGLLLLPPPALPEVGALLGRSPLGSPLQGTDSVLQMHLVSWIGGVKSSGPDLLKYSVSLHSRSLAPYLRCQPSGTVGLSGCWQRANEETFVQWQIKAVVSGYLL